MGDPRQHPRFGREHLTTAEITYHMPDHPGLLQTFVWQTHDIAPKFPRIVRFLDYWRREIDAAIHSVRVSARGVAMPADWRGVDVELPLQ